MSVAKKKEVIVKLSGNLQKSTSLFRKQSTEAVKVTRACYEVSCFLARWMKLFTDEDFIKECIMVVIEFLCPEKRSAFENVNLSPRTVCRRIEMSDSVNDSLKPVAQNSMSSLALDENNDMNDTAQLAIFIRGVTAALQIYEEFLQFVPLHGTTTEQNIFDAMLQCVKLAVGQFMHFLRIATCTPDDVGLNTCVGAVTSLREEFASRLTGVRPLAPGFKLFTYPFDFPVDEASVPLQMELVNLQCNDELRAKYHTAFPLSFRDLVLPS